MYHGHDPRAVDEYPWRDVQLFLSALPELVALESPFGE